MIRWWPYWWWTHCVACDLAAIRAGSYLARCAGCARARAYYYTAGEALR